VTTERPNPYVGPRPFDEEDAPLFFGREAEVRELVSRVVANRVVLFYAASGAGKTSLLNAGAIPLLRDEERFEVLPRARLRRLTGDQIRRSDAQNVYALATMLNWTDYRADGKRLPRNRLARFLKRLPQPRDERGRRVPRAIVFDQFEELFTVYPEQWEQRADYFAQLDEALRQDAHLRVVLSLREDYVALLDPYLDFIPTPVRFRLERLGPDAALSATVGPLEATGRRFAPGVAEKLVSDLRTVFIDTGRGESAEVLGEFVEPVQLQVVCRNLCDALPADVDVVDADHVERFGDVDEVLSGLYAEAVMAAAKVGEIREGDLRTRLEQAFVTPMGTRGTVVVGHAEAGGIPIPAVEELERRYLLRGEYRARARWLELTHDRLIEPLRSSNEQFRAAARSRFRRRVFAVGLALAAILGAVVAGFLALASGEESSAGETVQTEFSTTTVPVGPPPPPPTTSAFFSPDGRLLVTARGRTVSVRAWRTGIVLDSLGQPQPVSTADFDSTGHLVVIAGGDGIARIWRPASSETPVELRPQGAAQPLSSASFGGAGDSLVVTAGEGGPVRIWSWRNARVLAELPARPARQYRTAAFSPDGTAVVAASSAGAAYVWRWRAKAASVVELRAADSRVPLSGAAFSPDGKLVVTGSDDATVLVWEWRTQTPVGSLLRSQIQTQVATVGFSPDGRRILTASADGIARIWNRSNPDSLVVLRQSGGQPVPLFSAAFSGDGSLVATASERGASVWYPDAVNGPIQCAGVGTPKGGRERCPR
jgi:hypothetical protein